MRPAHQKPAGFTLIELSVGLLLVALLMAVSLPAIRSVTAAQLRRSASQIAGMSREAYARAAISGKPHRLVMNLDDNTFRLEEASGFFVLKQEKQQQLSEDEIAQRNAAVRAEPGRSAADDDEEERLKRSLSRGPEWTPVADELGLPVPLPADCTFDRVWVAHQKEAFVRGETAVHYWPSGRAETAIIRLTDDPQGATRIISVKINGLTGRAMVRDYGVEVPSS